MKQSIMLKRFLLLFVVMLLLSVFTACNRGEAEDAAEQDVETTASVSEEPFSPAEIDAAKAVIAEYEQAFNAKDREAVLKTLTDRYAEPNMVLWEGNETLSVEVTSYDPNDPNRESYVTNGIGSQEGTKVENVIVFRTNYVVAYPEGESGSFGDGTVENADWAMILVREDKESPWRIGDMGH